MVRSRAAQLLSLFAFTSRLFTLLVLPSHVISGTDLRFHMQITTTDTLRPARGGRELQQWWLSLSAIMNQVKDVSWSLLWEDLLGRAGAPNDEGLQRRLDNPDLDGKELEMSQLMQCVNEQYRPSDMSWDAAMADQQGAFKVVGSWWSNHQPSAPLTVVTSASISRLPQLYAQCLSWSGPTSVVLYQALPSDPEHPGSLSPANMAILRAAVLQVTQFIHDMQNQPSACKPDVTLMYEMYNDESARQLLYPCNTPRNLARLQARTPMVALVDVDLVLSHSLSVRANDTRAMSRMMQRATRDRAVFIIPAFDVRGTHGRAAWADALVSPTSNKEMLVYAFERDVVFQFASETYPVAHAMTNYQKWKTAEVDYYSQYQEMSEPWVIGDRLMLPWHDGRYRGYGLNKQQWIAHVNASGFVFRVMHDSFTVHRAHKKNKAKDVFVKGITSRGLDPRLFAHNAALFKAQMAKHKTGVFVPSLNRATAHCLSVLPWWRGAAS